MTETTNSDRAEWGLLGLQTFRNRVAHGEYDRDLTQLESFDEALSDMLGNLMHYANQQGWLENPKENPMGVDIPEWFADLLERGRRHYEDELAEEQDEERDDGRRRPTALCNCGHELIWVSGSWYHNVAGPLWGQDHEPSAEDPPEADRMYWDMKDWIEVTTADAPDCRQCGASNTGSRTPPYMCETCMPI